VLTHTAGEDDRVEPTENSVIRADVLANAMAVHIHRERGVIVAGRAAVKYPPHVLVAAESGQSTVVLQKVVHFGLGHSAEPLQVSGDAWIQVTGPGAHDEPFQGSQAHRRVHATSTSDGGGAGAVAEMQDDLVQRVDRPCQHPGCPLGDVSHRDPVETVPPDPDSSRETRVERVGRRRGGQPGVECGVEDGDLGDAREGVPGGLDALYSTGIVQRRQRHEFADGRDNIVVHNGRTDESIRSVNDAVSDRDEPSRVERGGGQHGLQRLAMVGHVSWLADAFDQPTGNTARVVRIHDSVLDR
jgi:hypothetical protein